MEVTYSFDTTFGSFRMNMLATYMSKNDENLTGKEADKRNAAGEYTDPRWKARFTTNYTYENLQVNLIGAYRHSTVWSNDWVAEDNNYNDISSYTKWDLTARYNITDGLQVRGGMLNVFDRTPPRHPSLYDDGEYFDLNGRTFTLGVNYKF